jgi:hypothetical protein
MNVNKPNWFRPPSNAVKDSMGIRTPTLKIRGEKEKVATYYNFKFKSRTTLGRKNYNCKNKHKNNKTERIYISSMLSHVIKVN